MEIIGTTIYLSASDLSTYISCSHATFLNLQLSRKLIPGPPYYDNPSLAALIKKGEEFETNYINELKTSGKTVIEITRGDRKKALLETEEAMKKGVDVICQARLEYDIWHGWADFLIKVDKPSKLGDWSYEVMDTKLSKETRAGAILQISLYSEMLEQLQGVKPELMHIKNPSGEHHYRVDDFAAYYRLMKRNLLNAINNPLENYPDPVPHCEICRWWERCNQRRRVDDHLSFIAGMGSTQTREVQKWGVTTLESMATLEIPLIHEPERGSTETYEKLTLQARLQLKTRSTKKTAFEILELQPGFGFYQLPEPSEHDMFFDFEGDPFVGNHGIEYLFGWYYRDKYYDLWATNDAEEKQALENYIDEVMRLRNIDNKMHVYHFGAYEQSALKRLVGKYATREDELDTLLRANVFIDLHTIIRHAIRAGIESYSLKDLEKIHGYVRIRDLRLVGQQKTLYEGLLESGYVETADEETVAVVRDYNMDDCISTKYLRDWLETQRQQLITEGNEIARPIHEEGEASENIKEFQERIKPIFDALMRDIPFEKENRSPEQQAKWLLANMLEWYRREKKSFWWEYFRLSTLDDEDLMEEDEAIAGLHYIGKKEQVKKSVVHFYRFPKQEFTLKVDGNVSFNAKRIGSIHSIDLANQIIGIRKSKNAVDVHPTNVVGIDEIKDTQKEEAIIRVAKYVVQNGITGDGDYKAGRDLLLRTMTENPSIENAVNMRNSVLPIQGPPGTGKSHTAAMMIVSLIKAGKKIGISALSHKVITSLLEKVNKAASKENIKTKIIQKVGDLTNRKNVDWIETKDNDVIDYIRKGYNIAAGTSFMWSREDLFEAVDFLFVDEAGQLSLIDTLALSHAGNNLILMGDPQQLKQPQKGSHPEGTEVSALEHILQEHKTISANEGVFLGTTWRMHPAINGYVSELFYDNRLHSKPETANQKLEGNTKYQLPGLYVEPVVHEGNQNSSEDEAEKAVSIVNELLNNDVLWIDCDKQTHKLQKDHIKIIAPYNAQVELLQQLLPGIQIGTVDKFQGQEAPVIIFSMATSTPEDAPRGMEFLYSLNRLNVAVSRARAVFILVASPALFQPSCKSPHQMQLANALCRLLEMGVK
jgi:predicted RecB family nuclease